MTAVLIAGIWCGTIWFIDNFLVLAFLNASLVAVFSLHLLKKEAFVYEAFLACIFFLGILEINLYLYPPIPANHIVHCIDGKKITAEGVISENPKVSPEKTYIVVSLSRMLEKGHYRNVSGKVLLSMNGQQPLRYGDFIRFHARLKKPRNFKNPGGFDYERGLRFRGILVRGFLNDEISYVILRRGQGNPLKAKMAQFRENIRQTIAVKSPGTQGSIIQAMILGNQEAIGNETMEKFNKTGLTHIIAISGFNIGIVAAFALFLARLALNFEYILLRFNVIKLSVVSSILVVIFYTGVAGAGISVIRASIMLTAFLSALLLDRQGDLYNILAFAAFLILIVTPYSLFAISFQLSFVAVAALIFFMPKFIAILPPIVQHKASQGMKGKLIIIAKNSLRGFGIFFLASVTATLGTLPLITLYFNRIPLIGIAANMICVPILGILAIPVSLAIVVAVPVSSFLAGLIISLAELLVKISLYFIDWFASFSWASIFVPTPSIAEVAAFYILLVWAGLVLNFLSKNATKRKTTNTFLFVLPPLAVMLFFTVSWTYPYLKDIHQENLSLTVIDVGQGSSILVEFPKGKKMLVDGGGFFDKSFDIGKTVVAPYLWHKRITSIDTVVLTHPDADHLNGLLFILENFTVGEVWCNGDYAPTEQYASFLEIIRKRHIQLKIISNNEPERDFSGVRLKVLNPPSKDHTYCTNSGSDDATKEIRHTTQNDRSLVIRLSFGEKSLLLTSDISSHAENQLIESGWNLNSDVLIVPHHGSRFSSSLKFLKKVKPKIAIVSCGSDNVFGFPHRETVKRYASQGVKVYRTDYDGAVTVKTDGRNLVVEHFL